MDAANRTATAANRPGLGWVSRGGDMAERFFPFRAMGFKCNPFRTLTDAEWAAVAVVPPTLLAAITNTSAPVQLLGEAGRGKTTTLLAVQALFAQKGVLAVYQYLPEGTRRFDYQKAAAAQVFLLDEAQRLTHGERRRLCRLTTGTRVLFSSHQDLTAECAAHKVSLTTVRLSKPEPAHLARILTVRLAYFSTGTQPVITITPDAIEYLHARFGGNLRLTERFLYEVFQWLVRHSPAEKKLTAARLESIAKNFPPVAGVP